jgi:hypothetical protein
MKFLKRINLVRHIFGERFAVTNIMKIMAVHINDVEKKEALT